MGRLMGVERVGRGRCAGLILAGMLGAAYVAADERPGVEEQASLVKAIPFREAVFLQNSESGANPLREQSSGLVPVVAVDSALTEMRIGVDSLEARGALGFVVPAGQTLQVSVEHGQSSWFQVVTVNRYGMLQAGMYQNVQQLGRAPEASFANTTQKAQAVYVLVRYPDFVYQSGGEYLLKISRSN